MQAVLLAGSPTAHAHLIVFLSRRNTTGEYKEQQINLVWPNNDVIVSKKYCKQFSGHINKILILGCGYSISTSTQV